MIFAGVTRVTSSYRRQPAQYTTIGRWPPMGAAGGRRDSRDDRVAGLANVPPRPPTLDGREWDRVPSSDSRISARRS